MFSFLNECNIINSINLESGARVFQEGDSCHYIAFIKSGVIRVTKLGQNGREMLLYRVVAGESCVLTISSILSNSLYPAHAVVEEPSEILLLSAEEFKKQMTSNLGLQQYTYSILMNRFLSVMSMLEDIVFLKVDQRIIEFLISKSNQDNGSLLELTHEDIAIELGTAREVVSRILKGLEREGLIKQARGKIKLVNIKKICDKLVNM
ncbi:Crp/Fnr family transcriptional regulator [Bacillus sp. HMF5848]|nr:Crp/Fnr family transcriptional regulator [Bacillus sp. HMF5848]